MRNGEFALKTVTNGCKIVIVEILRKSTASISPQYPHLKVRRHVSILAGGLFHIQQPAAYD